MPLRVLDGWVPAEVHVYRYDDAGRVDHVEVRRESVWSVEEAEQFEALSLLEHLTCPGCGTVHGLYPEGTPFMVDMHECPGCRSKAVVERDTALEHEKDKPKPKTPFWSDGLRFSVTPRPDLRRAPKG